MSRSGAVAAADGATIHKAGASSWALPLAQWLASRSFGVNWRIAQALGSLHLRGHATFREMMATNLTLCFPHLSIPQRVALARVNATETFFSVFDRLRCWQLTESEVRDQVTLDGADILHRYMGQQPVVLVCPHFLGLEAGVQRLALEGRMMSLYRPGRAAAFEALRLRARQRFNRQQLVPVGGSLMPMVRRLRAGTPLFLLPDLDLGSTASVFSPFFGVQAATVRTTAWCALRLGAVVLPFSIRRVEGRRYRARIHEPLSDLPGDIAGVTDRVNLALQALIIDNPTQYWWLLPRFATRPAGQAPFYSPEALRRADC